MHLSQLACVLLFPIWMYTDVWTIITTLHKVRINIMSPTLNNDNQDSMTAWLLRISMLSR